MTTKHPQYNPDYAVSPGRILGERLGALDLSQAEFARRCNRSSKLISEIIAAKAPVEPETALQFQRVLGVDASIWLGLEANYRLYQAKVAESVHAAKSANWVQKFPIQELVSRDVITKPESNTDAFSQLLSFFGVASVEAWQNKYGRANIAYRHSPVLKSNEFALATWLRLGEVEADGQDCSDYSESQFKKALREIRGLTRNPIEANLPHVQELCNQSGVALVLIEPTPKLSVRGAAWWLNPKKAVIQLNAKHKSDYDLWFSFMHEAAHIHLHSKKNIFLDGNDEGNDGIEAEANNWAANALIPQSVWEQYTKWFLDDEQAVQALTKAQEIAPEVVVGMLQRRNRLYSKDQKTNRNIATQLRKKNSTVQIRPLMSHIELEIINTRLDTRNHNGNYKSSFENYVEIEFPHLEPDIISAKPFTEQFSKNLAKYIKKDIFCEKSGRHHFAISDIAIHCRDGSKYIETMFIFDLISRSSKFMKDSSKAFLEHAFDELVDPTLNELVPAILIVNDRISISFEGMNIKSINATANSGFYKFIRAKHTNALPYHYGKTALKSFVKKVKKEETKNYDSTTIILSRDSAIEKFKTVETEV